MKKTPFMRTFNLNINLILSSILSGFFGWTLKFLAITLNQISLGSFDLSKVSLYLGIGSHYCYLTFFVLLSVLAFLVTLEIVNRIRFEKSEKVTTIDNQTITTYNPINGSFNRCAHKSVADIRKDEVKVFLKVPRDQQGQKILSDMTFQLKEEVSSQHPDYYFSAPNRVRNNLWLVGKKR